MAPQSADKPTHGTREKLEPDTGIRKYILSSISGMVAESVTYPMDLTKTRLHLQGESNVVGKTVSHTDRGMFKILYGIITEEGFHKLWQGIPASLSRQIVYTGFRINIYEHLRDDFFMKRNNGEITVAHRAICSAVAGALGQLAASPNDLVKIRLQMEGRLRLEGHTPRTLGFFSAFKSIYMEGGIAGLWRGWFPNIQRAALVNIGDFVTYDIVKRQLLTRTNLPDTFVVHGLSSACAGLVAAILCCPADVVKSRIMNQPTKDGRPLLYKGTIDCVLKTVRQEGVTALFKGLLPSYCRLGPWFLTFWITYEKLRNVMGHSSF